jgi:hypothetical protein
MDLMSLSDEILELIVFEHDLPEIQHPVYVNPPRYTRAAVPYVDCAQVDVKTSWHVPMVLWHVNRRLRKISLGTIAISLTLEQEHNILPVMDSGKLKLETWVFPEPGLRLNFQHIRAAKILGKPSTFKHLAALVKFANGEIEQSLKSATHIQILILEGISDIPIFLDRFCFLLADAQSDFHSGPLYVQILGAEWKQSSLDRVAHATRIVTRKKPTGNVSR